MTTFLPTIARYWCVTDLETTGLEHTRHEIIQIARVVIDTVDLNIVANLTISQYVQPNQWDHRDEAAMAVNGITLSKLQAEAVSPDQALAEFCQDVNWDETVLAAWGADFETKFLREAFSQMGRDVPFHYKVIDVRSLAHLPRASLGYTEYLGLGESCEYYAVHFDRGREHDALYDATKTAEVALALLRLRN